jgi:ATP-dependent DNA ligase
MQLPVLPPVAPMLARAVPEMPVAPTGGPGLIYEPKWDGFRAIIFRDGDDIELGSRGEKPLTRYFPEVVEAVRSRLPSRIVLDGEIVIAGSGGLDFEALLGRIHPAASRVRLLARQTPASLVAFDLLAVGDEDLTGRPFAERRARLVGLLADVQPPVYLTPATEDPAVAGRWFAEFEGAGLDGVIAKPVEAPYRPGQRTMFKVKHARTADCVVGGFRWHASGPVVGSLLLGLYDADGRLQHVGVTAAFPLRRRRELVDELAPYRDVDAEHPWLTGPWAAGGPAGRVPGAPSRWNGGKDLSFEPLRPELVCEVGYDHMQGDRFRHATTFQRWRPDRDPRSCTYAQLERPVGMALAEVLAAR